MRWTIGKKLTLAFFGMGLVAVAVGTVGITNILLIERADTVMYERATLPLELLARMGVASQRIRIILRDVVVETDPARLQERSVALAEMWTLMERLMRQYEPFLAEAPAPETFIDLRRAYDAHRGLSEEVLTLVRQGRRQEALKTLQQHADKDRAFRAALDTLIERTVRTAAAIERRNTVLAVIAVVTMLAVILLGFLAAALLARLMARSITVPLRKGVLLAEAIAQGDLTARMDVRTGDELQTLAEALNTTVARLEEMFRDIRQTAEQMAETNEEVSGYSPTERT